MVIFNCKMFGGFKIKYYLCTVFFIVLDLRLTKVWVAAATLFLFYICTTFLLP